MHLNALASHTMHLVFTHGIYNTLLIMRSILGNMCIIHAANIIGWYATGMEGSSKVYLVQREAKYT